ncbi:HlyD family efflux transporter periplasmic adaptor subunit [Arcobacteraceae bacterium]|nr:HlyD family efflux transporter periplasmic adaptor subunit [Arcobacteraceae bacterium]
MRIFIYVMLLLIITNAKPLEVSQLFNKKTVKVTKQNINLIKTFYGDVVIPDGSIKDINIRFDGFIGDIAFDNLYSAVKRGDKLFDIYSSDINLAMHEYLMSNKKLRHNYLQKFKSFAIDKKVLNDLEKTKRVKEYINVYSPYEGFIISKNINDGSFAKKGKKLFQIANLQNLWVIAKIYQKDISSIKKGMKANVNIDGVGTVSSIVEFIYPNVNMKDKTVNIRLEIQNKDLKIYPNMFAKVSIKTLEKSMLVLPKTAVLTKADKHFVFIPDGKEFEPKEIIANRINSEQFEVIGLNENDIVIDKAAFLLDSDAITNGLYESSTDDDDW